MAVRREIAESRGEPAGRRPVAAVNRRVQQKCSWIMRSTRMSG